MSDLIKESFMPSDQPSNGFGRAILGGIESGARFADASTSRAISERNAKLQELAADVVLEDHHKQALVELQMARIIQGEQSSKFASGGVVTTTGTPAILSAAEASQAAIRAANAISVGQSKSKQLLMDAESTRFEGKARSMASNTAGFLALAKGAASFKPKKKGLSSAKNSNI